MSGIPNTIWQWLSAVGLLVAVGTTAQALPDTTRIAAVAAQDNPGAERPAGRFLTDTIEIGRPFLYTLSVRHPAGDDLFFPDTGRSFAPFRVRTVALFPTRTRQAGMPDASSLDSAVYTLVTFETTLVQTLQVPVKITRGTDSVLLFSPPDTVFLRARLSGAAPPATLTLVSETAVVPLRQQFNYPYLLLAMLTLLIMLGVVYGLFNRSIQRQWGLYQLDQRHIRFLRAYNQLTGAINAQTAADVSNQAIIRWKMYLERLERQPYSSLTSREIADRFNNDQLTEALREADQMIYGDTFSEQSKAALRVLREKADQIYVQRRLHLRANVATMPDALSSIATDSDV